MRAAVGAWADLFFSSGGVSRARHSRKTLKSPELLLAVNFIVSSTTTSSSNTGLDIFFFSLSNYSPTRINFFLSGICTRRSEHTRFPLSTCPSRPVNFVSFADDGLGAAFVCVCVCRGPANSIYIPRIVSDAKFDHRVYQYTLITGRERERRESVLSRVPLRLWFAFVYAPDLSSWRYAPLSPESGISFRFN